MRRRRKDDAYIEPETLTVNVDGTDYPGTISYHRLGDSMYHYTVTFRGESKHHRGSRMPNTEVCKIHGRHDLIELVKAWLERERKQDRERREKET